MSFKYICEFVYNSLNMYTFGLHVNINYFYLKIKLKKLFLYLYT